MYIKIQSIFFISLDPREGAHRWATLQMPDVSKGLCWQVQLQQPQEDLPAVATAGLPAPQHQPHHWAGVQTPFRGLLERIEPRPRAHTKRANLVIKLYHNKHTHLEHTAFDWLCMKLFPTVLDFVDLRYLFYFLKSCLSLWSQCVNWASQGTVSSSL